MVDWSFKLQLISPWFCAFKVVSQNSLQNYLKYTKLAKCCCTRCIIILYVPLWQIVVSLALRPCNRHKQREVVFALVTVHHYPLVEWESIKSYYITRNRIVLKFAENVMNWFGDDKYRMRWTFQICGNSGLIWILHIEATLARMQSDIILMLCPWLDGLILQALLELVHYFSASRHTHRPNYYYTIPSIPFTPKEISQHRPITRQICGLNSCLYWQLVQNPWQLKLVGFCFPALCRQSMHQLRLCLTSNICLLSKPTLIFYYVSRFRMNSCEKTYSYLNSVNVENHYATNKMYLTTNSFYLILILWITVTIITLCTLNAIFPIAYLFLFNGWQAGFTWWSDRDDTDWSSIFWSFLTKYNKTW